MPLAISPVFVVLLVIVGLFVLAWIIGALAQRRTEWAWRTNRRPAEYRRAERGDGLGLDELAERLGLDAHRLQSGTPAYQRREIPKRRGGTRVLQVPDERTKEVQSRILRRLLARLRSHPAAMAFEEGRSIVHNAKAHLGRPTIVRLDIVDFFPATRAERVDAYFRRVGWDSEAAAILTKWTTHSGGLPQGAPTSPRLSNLLNYYLDVQLTRHMGTRRGSYTRYADDITLGLPTTHPRFARGRIQYVRRLLKVHGYTMHGRPKLRLQSRWQRQIVTGLVVNEKVQLPRETRRWLRAVRHHKATGRPGSISDESLAGWTALEGMIELQRGEARPRA